MDRCGFIHFNFRFLASMTYYRFPNHDHLHLRIFIVGLIMSAALWGIADSILMPSNDLSAQMIIIVIVAGITAGGIQTLNANLAASLIYVGLIVTPLSLWLLVQNGLTYLTLGIAMTTYLIFMLVTSIRGYKLLERSLNLQYENVALIKELSESNEKMVESYKLLEQHENDIIHINKLNDLLQVCKKMDEAYPVVEFIAKALFPKFNGSLVFLNTATNNFEVVKQWGRDQTVNTIFNLNSCWALRKGANYSVNNSETQLICDHFLIQPNSYICFPLIIQNEISGSFILYTNEKKTITKYQQQLATSFIEVIQLSLSNIKLHETLYAQAIHDSLTGLYNRRHIDAILPKALQQIIHEKRYLCVVMIDLDYFKMFNDANGHEAGDLVLKVIGSLLQNNVRSGDIVCRYGGEEFLIILNDADLMSASSRLELIREAVKRKKCFEGRLLPHLTISVGIAEAPKQGEAAKDIISAADKAMYMAKEAGRDRVSCFSRTPIST